MENQCPTAPAQLQRHWLKGRSNSSIRFFYCVAWGRRMAGILSWLVALNLARLSSSSGCEPTYEQGGWRAAGFAKPVDWRAFLLFLPPLAGPVIILLVTGIAATNAAQLLMLVVFTAMIGFAEEALCRGVMVQSFLPQGC
jgi:membrane protease YdiL (CAAX protease family)